MRRIKFIQKYNNRLFEKGKVKSFESDHRFYEIHSKLKN